jgi:phosphonate transport system ATP-binding protein
VLWNTLALSRPGMRLLHGLLRFPRAGEWRAAVQALDVVGLGDRADARLGDLGREEQVRVLIARELLRGSEWVVIKEPDVALGCADAAAVLERLRRLARTERFSVLTSVAEPAIARRLADRVIAIADGVLVFDGPPDQLTEDGVAWKLRLPDRADPAPRFTPTRVLP